MIALLVEHLSAMLRGRPCRVTAEAGRVVIVCQPMFGVGEATPLAVIEVRPPRGQDDTPPTEPGLRHRLVVDPEIPRVHHLHRYGSEWRRAIIEGPDAVLTLDSLDIALPLSALYAGR